MGSEIATEAQFEAWKTLTDQLLWPLRRAVEKANATVVAENIEAAEALEPYEPGPPQMWYWRAWDSFHYREVISPRPIGDDSLYTRREAVCLTEEALNAYKRESALANQRNYERQTRNKKRAERIAAALVSLGFERSVPTGSRKPFRNERSISLFERLIQHLPTPPRITDDCVHTAKSWMEAEEKRVRAEEYKVLQNEATERLVKRGFRLGTDFTVERAITFETNHPEIEAADTCGCEAEGE